MPAMEYSQQFVAGSDSSYELLACLLKLEVKRSFWHQFHDLDFQLCSLNISAKSTYEKEEFYPKYNLPALGIIPDQVLYLLP